MAYNITLSTSLGSPPVTAITIPNGGLDQTTAIDLAGKGNTEYIQIIQESLLHLSENFCSATMPTTVVEGMTWYNSNTKLVNVAHSDYTFSDVGLIVVGNTEPTPQGPLWYDTNVNVLKVFTGTVYNNSMIDYLLLSGGTITGSLVIGNEELNPANQPTLSINGSFSASTIASVYGYISGNLTVNNITSAVANTSTIDMTTMSLNHRNNILFDVSTGALNVYNNNTGNLVITFSGMLDTVTSNVNTSLTNKQSLNVGDATLAGHTINYNQLGAVKPLATNTLLLKDGSTEMGGALSVYNLYLQNQIVLSSIRQDGGVNYPFWKLTAGATTSPSRLDLSIQQVNSSGTVAVIDVEELVVTPRIHMPTQVKNIVDPTAATNGATVNYLNTTIDAMDAVVTPTRYAKMWTIIEANSSGILTRKGHFNTASISYNPGVPDLLSTTGEWLLEPHVAVNATNLEADDVVVVSPLYDISDSSLTALLPTSLNLWETEGSIQTTHPTIGNVSPYVRVDVKYTDSQEMSRTVAWIDTDDTHVFINDYNAEFNSSFTPPKSMYMYVVVYGN